MHFQTLSDELTKTDSIVESIVRKVEKAGADFLGKKGGELTVGGVPPQRYTQQFVWDYAKYPNRRPLKELVSLIAGGVTAIDEELKQLGISYVEKQKALMEFQRKKGGNLMIADLNDVLTADIMQSVEVKDTEYLQTVFIAVPMVMKENFESTVYTIGDQIAGFGGPDWSRDPSKLGEPVKFGSLVDRQKTRGSPVVPGSLNKIFSDSESILYSVTLLKGQYESGFYEGDKFVAGKYVDFVKEFTKACRDKRFVVREFQYEPSQASKSAMAYEQLQVEVDGMRSGLMRWCKTHYGEAYVAWMHIKVVRVFVESVLRYGLPVDFTAVLYKVNPGKEPQLTQALDKALGNADSAAGMGEEGEDDFHDFVLLKFDP
jgi:V-type H+-transporting ATPase subunit C